MKEGYIYLPEDVFLNMNQELKIYKRASIISSAICGVLGYLLYAANKENTKEKAG